MNKKQAWQRYQRVLRLQREHDDLNARGVRLLERVRVVMFDDWCDVRQEASG